MTVGLTGKMSRSLSSTVRTKKVRPSAPPPNQAELNSLSLKRRSVGGHLEANSISKPAKLYLQRQKRKGKSQLIKQTNKHPNKCSASIRKAQSDLAAVQVQGQAAMPRVWIYSNDTVVIKQNFCQNVLTSNFERQV